MKKYILLFLIVIISGFLAYSQSEKSIKTEKTLVLIEDNQSVQNQEEYKLYQGRYNKAVKKRTGGLIIALSGVVCAGTGFFIIEAERSKSIYQRNRGLMNFGAILNLIGFIGFNVGVPILMANNIKAKRNLEAMELLDSKAAVKLSLGMTNNGLGLVLQF